MLIQTLIRTIDTFSDITGRLLTWLSLIMMLLLCTVVVLRYGFSIGAIVIQESVIYLHGTIFMLGAAYTYKNNGHVRVDIFYRDFSIRKKAWINSLGAIIFVLPICAYIFLISWDFVIQSWQIGEVSTEPGGIPAIFLLKTLIPAMAINLSLQALAEILRNSLILIESRA
jgi:TRAP-type mannitol/chloroaromatic compound transport system permease small subunit